jgi:hypothetical protein
MTQLPIPALLRPLSYIDFLNNLAPGVTEAKSYLLACMAQPSARPVPRGTTAAFQLSSFAANLNPR